MAPTKGRALIILAEGAEEMEVVITADVLRRGKVGFCLELWCINTDLECNNCRAYPKCHAVSESFHLWLLLGELAPQFRE